jgi:hypothetical protein
VGYTIGNITAAKKEVPNYSNVIKLFFSKLLKKIIYCFSEFNFIGNTNVSYTGENE